MEMKLEEYACILYCIGMGDDDQQLKVGCSLEI